MSGRRTNGVEVDEVPPDQSTPLTVWVFAWDGLDQDYALDYTSDDNAGTAFVAIEILFPFVMDYSSTGNGDYGKETTLEWSIGATGT